MPEGASSTWARRPASGTACAPTSRPPTARSARCGRWSGTSPISSSSSPNRSRRRCCWRTSSSSGTSRFYNARLKDDKTYPYIKIDLREEFPRVYFTRRVISRRRAVTSGRSPAASSVRKTMDLLKKLFPYRSCTKVITGTDERPCLELLHPPLRCALHRRRRPGRLRRGSSTGSCSSLEGRLGSCRTGAAGEHGAGRRNGWSTSAPPSSGTQLKAIAIGLGETRRSCRTATRTRTSSPLAHDKGEVWVELFKIRRGKLIGRGPFPHGRRRGRGGSAVDRTLRPAVSTRPLPTSPGRSSSSMRSRNADAVRGVAQRQARQARGAAASAAGREASARRDGRRQRARGAQPAEGEVARRIRQGPPGTGGTAGGPQPPRTAGPHRVLRHLQHPGGPTRSAAWSVFEHGRPKTAHYRRFQIKGRGR